jgi:two-component system, OmpR family, sensor histidine kinase VicK
MIFSAINTFHLQERQLGITKILTNLSNQGVSIRILTPIDDQVRELIADLKEQQEVKKLQQRQQQLQQQLQKQKLNQKSNENCSSGSSNNNSKNTDSIIEIQDIAPSSYINTKIIVVDNQDSLAMEIKDGKTDSIHHTIGLSTLSNSKSTIASYSAIFENLSKQNQLYKQLKEAYRTIEKTNVIQQEFINVAAHELRTPIQPILGYAELLLETETDDNKKQLLMRIVHNSERLQKLASDILDVARMDSNTFRLYTQPLNLNYVISNIVKDYVKRQEQKKASDITRLISNINLSNYKDKDNNVNASKKKGDTKLFFESRLKEDIFVEADIDRLTQVICNLLDNAFKFTEGHGEGIQVTLDKQEQEQPQQQKGHNAIISIKDSGTGVDPGILPKLFTKFATKSHKGTGLGLYISKNIVEAHRGRLYGENNTNNKGATFTIVLPLLRQQYR